MYEQTAGRDLKRSFEWLEFAAGLPSHVVPWTNQNASFQGFKGRCILQSVVGINGNAGTQSIKLHDGEDASGPLIFPTAVAGNGYLIQPFSPRGILCETGVFVEIPAGPWTLSLLLVPLWHYNVTPPGE